MAPASLEVARWAARRLLRQPLSWLVLGALAAVVPLQAALSPGIDPATPWVRVSSAWSLPAALLGAGGGLGVLAGARPFLERLAPGTRRAGELLALTAACLGAVAAVWAPTLVRIGPPRGFAALLGPLVLALHVAALAAWSLVVAARTGFRWAGIVLTVGWVAHAAPAGLAPWTLVLDPARHLGAFPPFATPSAAAWWGLAPVVGLVLGRGLVRSRDPAPGTRAA